MTISVSFFSTLSHEMDENLKLLLSLKNWLLAYRLDYKGVGKGLLLYTFGLCLLQQTVGCL